MLVVAVYRSICSTGPCQYIASFIVLLNFITFSFKYIAIVENSDIHLYVKANYSL